LKAVIAVRMEDSALPCSILAVDLMPTMMRHAGRSMLITPPDLLRMFGDLAPFLYQHL
jgi:hypothetical protein